jgi:hypothetical protein
LEGHSIQLGILVDAFRFPDALASFGHMIMWENDRAHLARQMVRARVTDLREVPYFLVLTKVEGFQGES